MKQLSPTDSLFVFNETPSTPLHISPLLIYDPPADNEAPIRFKDILKRFEERLFKSPIFRRKLSGVPLVTIDSNERNYRTNSIYSFSSARCESPGLCRWKCLRVRHYSAPSAIGSEVKSS